MTHQKFTHIFLVSLCCESRYFEDIVNLRIFRLRTIYNFSRSAAQVTPNRKYYQSEIEFDMMKEMYVAEKTTF